MFVFIIHVLWYILLERLVMQGGERMSEAYTNIREGGQGEERKAEQSEACRLGKTRDSECKGPEV